MKNPKIRNYSANVKYKLRLLVLITLTASLQSCISPHLTKLEPENGASRWYKGLPVTESQTSQHKISVIYLGSTSYRHRFEVTVTNQSDSPIMIDYTNFSTRNATEASSGYQMNYLSASDNPELIIAELEKAIKAEKDQKTTDNLFGGIGAITQIIGEFAERTPEEEKKRNKEIKERDMADQLRDENYRKRLTDKERELDFWKNSYLRRTTLAKGESITGIIMFPVVSKASQFILSYRIGSSLGDVTYYQKPL